MAIKDLLDQPLRHKTVGNSCEQVCQTLSFFVFWNWTDGFPHVDFAQTSPPCAIRSNFNLIVIEASTSQEIRLTSGQGPFVADTLQMATTKARPRVSDGIKAFEAELSSKFPDYAYFQLVAENKG